MASTKVCVSGVTGFVGSQLAKDLLERGYIVHGTARNISDGKIQYITALPGARENFRAFQGDLLTPGAFDSALDGCSSAFHVASPYFMNSRDPQKELVDPALNGTRHFLESCVKIKSIKKVIVTSSVAAITDEGRKSHIFTEDDWNSKSSLKRLPYYYSKVLAEKFVWNFAEQHPEIKFVVINPFIVVGPSLVPSLNESNAIFKNIVEGKFPAILDFTWTLVDVRDVASAHIAALESSNASGRYICAATENPLKMQTIVHYLRDRGFNVSTRNLASSWASGIVRFAAIAMPGEEGTYTRLSLGNPILASNHKIKRDLSVTFRDPMVSLHDAIEDLVKWGHISLPRV